MHIIPPLGAPPPPDPKSAFHELRPVLGHTDADVSQTARAGRLGLVFGSAPQLYLRRFWICSCPPPPGGSRGWLDGGVVQIFILLKRSADFGPDPGGGSNFILYVSNAAKKAFRLLKI
jgi:hypothetical protein